LRKIAEAIEVSSAWLEGVEDSTPIDGVKLATFEGDGDVVNKPYLGAFKSPDGGSLKVGVRFLTLSKFWLDIITKGKPEADITFAQIRMSDMSPTIMKGDDVCYEHRKDHDGDPDGIWFVDFNSKYLLRRARPLSSGRYLLTADNPVLSPFEAAAEQLKFDGRIIWHGRSLIA
jgi:hypothetical protein